MHASIPAWNVLHEAIVHVPIVLLLTAPLFVVAGILLPASKRRLFLGSALALMALGTAAAIMALTTGEAAVGIVGSTPSMKAVLAEHRALAETTTGLFTLLTIGFSAYLFAPRFIGYELESRLHTVLLTIYLLLYTTGAIFLVHTALEGGQLARALETKSAPDYQMSVKETSVKCPRGIQ